ncbi:MAG: SAM-dependent methyltransferase, partial [Oscillospiraceae bacterium]|nr:SAM-dependent methyltransferase [Oscillospiraceae bacterium]
MNKTAIRNFAVTARQKLTAALPDEETAYLLFFYLTALRFMEVNSAGKKRIFTDENGLFQPICQEALTVHCQDLHQLFPKIFKKLELFPNVLFDKNGVIADMISMIPKQDWKEQVQIMGWLHQYYHSVQKNKTFANLRKNIKIPAEEIPAVTQLFTPEWIVRYMIENSLGRLWLEGH